jgi:hypothetical protein
LGALTLSAAAWVPDQPSPNSEFSQGEQWYWDWTVYAEISVSAADGDGRDQLLEVGGERLGGRRSAEASRS